MDTDKDDITKALNVVHDYVHVARARSPRNAFIVRIRHFLLVPVEVLLCHWTSLDPLVPTTWPWRK